MITGDRVVETHLFRSVYDYDYLIWCKWGQAFAPLTPNTPFSHALHTHIGVNVRVLVNPRTRVLPQADAPPFVSASPKRLTAFILWLSRVCHHNPSLDLEKPSYIYGAISYFTALKASSSSFLNRWAHLTHMFCHAKILWYDGKSRQTGGLMHIYTLQCRDMRMRYTNSYRSQAITVGWSLVT